MVRLQTLINQKICCFRCLNQFVHEIGRSVVRYPQAMRYRLALTFWTSNCFVVSVSCIFHCGHVLEPLEFGMQKDKCHWLNKSLVSSKTCQAYLPTVIFFVRKLLSNNGGIFLIRPDIGNHEYVEVLPPGKLFRQRFQA